ncbi:hypothetical protein D3C78_1549840 [compost metagenome]
MGWEWAHFFGRVGAVVVDSDDDVAMRIDRLMDRRRRDANRLGDGRLTNLGNEFEQLDFLHGARLCRLHAADINR